MDLQELRRKIDAIDGEMILLFERRMKIAAEIAEYKRENNLPVFDPERERQKLQDLSGMAKKEHGAHVEALFSLIFEISRAEQEKILNSEEV